jgi:cytochrome b
MKAAGIAPSDARVAVWDPSVRVLHWSLATSTVAAVASGFGGIAFFGMHKICGALVLGLCVTRLMLGFAGSTTARFGEFVRGPTAVWRYICSLAQSGHRRHFGHNPLGALMIVTLLATLLLQGTLGLWASDGIATEGPFAPSISEHLAEALGTLHSRIALVIMALVGTHVGAVVAYRLLCNHDLIGPMITGHAPYDSFVAFPKRCRPGLPAWKVLLVGAISVGAVVAVVAR